MHNSERIVVEQKPEIIQSCRGFAGDAERYCQAKMRQSFWVLTFRRWLEGLCLWANHLYHNFSSAVTLISQT